MNVIVLQVFVSLMLVASSVALFAWSVRRREHEHADRLSLLPLAADDGVGRMRTAPESTVSPIVSRPEVKP